MNKYAELLEKHVQWIALAIGGLWLLFMVYKYVVVAESSTVEVGGQTVGASSVDRFVHDTKAIPLREKMERVDKPTDKVENYQKLIVAQLGMETPPPLTDNFVHAGPSAAQQIGAVAVAPQQQQFVTALPVPPAPINVESGVGRSVVSMPPPPPAPGAQAGQPTPALLPWVTIAANIPMKALGDEFTQKITPPVPLLHQTTLLRVELQREELMPNGQWGNKQVIQSADFSATPISIPAWPNDKAQVADKLQFATAVSTQQKTLAQPAFYTVVRGDPWTIPGQAPAVNPNAQPAVAPAPPPPPPVMPPPVTPPRQPIPGSVKPGGNRPGSSGGRRSGERGDATPKLPAGTVAYGQLFNEPPPPTLTQPGAPGAPMPPGMGTPGVAPATPTANQPGQVPTAKFDPAYASDIQIWVHDTHVEAGKTYQYHIRYTILNPVFGANNACKPPTLGNEFALVSGWSQATKSVTIPNTTVFFAVAAPKVGQWDVKYVTFDVFTWDVNGLTKKSVNANAGDMVDEKLKISVVDIRDGGYTIILMDENGQLSTRNFMVDKDTPEYKTLLKEAAQPMAPVAGG